MPLFMIQSAFTADAWAILAKTPQNRAEAVRPAIEQIGGKLISYYFSFGEYDSVVIADLPDNPTAAAASIAAAAGGAIKAINTTPLMTVEEGMEAMRTAGEGGYRPPS
jgi:uncharacterized protein with GYD domain